MKSKADAQQRVDQIASFSDELTLLHHENVLRLNEEQQKAVNGYHTALIARLSETFDIDAGSREKQLSLGMKIASFIGALGMAASVFFLFYQFWGRFGTPVQVAILIAAPLVGLAGTFVVSSREKTGYFSKLTGLVTLACFVLNLSMLGQIFNITPSENAFLAWALFAFVLAYATDTRLLLAAGIISLAAFLSARAGTWFGCYWIYFGQRPEHFFPAALVIFALSFIPHHRYSGFEVIYRVFAMLIFFLCVLILSNWGSVSYIPLKNNLVEGAYQIAGFGFSALAIYGGIKRHWPEVVNTGNVFFTVFLYTKFYDWWWDWMPKYLFFLLIGLTALLAMVVFKRLRDLALTEKREVAL